MQTRGRPKRSKKASPNTNIKKDEGFFTKENLMYAGVIASVLISGAVGYKVFFQNNKKEEKVEEKKEENIIKVPEYPGKLGLPEIAVNPLIAKSFISHLEIIHREKLI